MKSKFKATRWFKQTERTLKIVKWNFKGFMKRVFVSASCRKVFEGYLFKG
jgi:hypothetical protein